MNTLAASVLTLGVGASLDMVTTVRGITNGTHEEANAIALAFQQRFGLLEGMILRECLIAVPLAIIGAVYLYHRTKSLRMASLAVWCIAAVHIIAAINNIIT